MNRDFWLKTWVNNDIGFHRNEVNPVLVQHFGELALPKSSRIFLPLCGKTHDIEWLLAGGYGVVGVELVELAVEQLFDDLDMQPKISKIGTFKRYNARNITIFVGDMFDLTPELLDAVDAVYDRAALVAWPKDMRAKYTTHVTNITVQAPQLLVTYRYDQTLTQGPPFSISKKEIDDYYGRFYNISLIKSADVRGGLKRKYTATKDIWMLR